MRNFLCILLRIPYVETSSFFLFSDVIEYAIIQDVNKMNAMFKYDRVLFSHKNERNCVTGNTQGRTLGNQVE